MRHGFTIRGNEKKMSFPNVIACGAMALCTISIGNLSLIN
jgi:hypothetical protein